jgi:aconitate hydratase
LPINTPPGSFLKAQVSLKAGDNISTDDITPASAELSSMRSNIPLIAEYAYSRYDKDFVKRAKEMGTSIIVGGENYGQGSSREHAAITPMYLGVKIVLAKSIARIHKNNLINHGVIPMFFKDPADYEKISLGDEIEISGFAEAIPQREVHLLNKTNGQIISGILDISDDEVEILLSGGQLSHLKKSLEGER